MTTELKRRKKKKKSKSKRTITIIPEMEKTDPLAKSVYDPLFCFPKEGFQVEIKTDVDVFGLFDKLMHESTKRYKARLDNMEGLHYTAERGTNFIHKCWCEPQVMHNIAFRLPDLTVLGLKARAGKKIPSKFDTVVIFRLGGWTADMESIYEGTMTLGKADGVLRTVFQSNDLEQPQIDENTNLRKSSTVTYVVGENDDVSELDSEDQQQFSDMFVSLSKLKGRADATIVFGEESNCVNITIKGPARYTPVHEFQHNGIYYKLQTGV